MNANFPGFNVGVNNVPALTGKVLTDGGSRQLNFIEDFHA